MVLFVAQFHAEAWLCVAPAIVAVGRVAVDHDVDRPPLDLVLAVVAGRVLRPARAVTLTN